MVTAFTAAHSITLAGSALQLLPLGQLGTRLAEAAIAASVLYVAAENLFLEAPRHRAWLTFAFGLVHGFGFASALRDHGLERSMVSGLLASTWGSSWGRRACAGDLPFVQLASRRRQAYLRAARLASAAIAATGGYWLIDSPAGTAVSGAGAGAPCRFLSRPHLWAGGIGTSAAGGGARRGLGGGGDRRGADDGAQRASVPPARACSPAGPRRVLPRPRLSPHGAALVAGPGTAARPVVPAEHLQDEVEALCWRPGWPGTPPSVPCLRAAGPGPGRPLSAWVCEMNGAEEADRGAELADLAHQLPQPDLQGPVAV